MWRWYLAAACLGFGMMASGGPSRAQEVSYQVEIVGAENALRDHLRSVSQLIAQIDRPPPSISALRRRVFDDLDRLRAALASWGYFEGHLDPRIDEAVEPVAVTITVQPGPEYRIGGYRLEAAGDSTLPAAARALSDLGLAEGAPFRAEAVLEAERRIVQRLGEVGYPLSVVPNRRVIADHATDRVDITFLVNAGPAARFGDVSVEGLTGIETELVRNRVTWRPGAVWDSRAVAETRQALVATGLFGSVRITPVEPVGADGLLPVRIELLEAEHRSVGAGVNYSTSEGPGATVFWEHRNLFSGGERLRLSAQASAVRPNLSAEYRQPDFLRVDQALLLTATASELHTDAFDSRRIGIAGAVERRFSDTVSGTAGLSVERLWSDERGRELDVTLVGTPLTATVDTSDSLLDPTRGTRLNLAATPYLEAIGSDLTFVVLSASDAVYWSIDEDSRYVLALRGTVGSIMGESRDDIPPEKRFYAGGGGSIRGYGFQLAGPLDANDDPLGGRSVITAGAEVRIRITDSIGIVPFIEAGTVSEEAVPNVDEDVFVGAGLGFRYFTSFGPIRVDVAVPLDRRGVDDAFQIYASIGQAF